MANVDSLLYVYLAIGATIPVARAIAAPDRAMNDPMIPMISHVLGNAPVALVIAVAVLVASAISALIWPALLISSAMKK